jgi:hypothetical protein
MQGASKHICAVLILLAGAASLLSRPAFAQEPDTATADESLEIEALEPGVDTSNADATPEGEVLPADGEEAVVDGAPEPETPSEVERVESGGRVMDRMELGRTEITGNQELPKVLYIVPWKKPEHGDLSGRPVNTLLDEVLAPVDREEFIRTVDYYRELNGDGTN